MVLFRCPNLYQNSYSHFRYFLIVIVFVTALYIVFGVSGYMVRFYHFWFDGSKMVQGNFQSFGARTKDIITLNLPKGVGLSPAMMVKLCLCIALMLTYPGLALSPFKDQ